jgi:hypothetical protein
MFELTNTPATLTSVTPRTEVHGDDKVFAISLGLKITGPNTLLDKLTPALRHMIYTAKPDATPELPGVEESTPLLRCPGVELMTLKAALEGWTLAVDHGIDEADPITLGGCKVDKFKVAPSQGGTVDLMFRIGSNDVDAEEAGLLCSHLSQEISITLTPPAPKPEAIDGTVGHPGAQPGPDAGELFADAHGGPEDEPSEGGETDIAGRGDNWPFPKDGSVLSDEELSRRTREAELQAEAAAGASKRTARGREATRKALAEGAAAHAAAGAQA